MIESGAPTELDVASVAVNGGLLVVAILAAIFAGLQARQARLSRVAAEKANNEAAEHERAALESARLAANGATRSAAALEEANEISKELLRDPDPEWLVEHRGGPVWAVINNMNITVIGVSVGTPRGWDETDVKFDNESVDKLEHGGALVFRVVAPTARRVTIILGWTHPRNMRQPLSDAVEVTFMP